MLDSRGRCWTDRASSRAAILLAAISCCSALFLLGSPAARAAGCNSWAKASSGSWFVAGNWSKGKVPAAGEEVCITLAGTYTVTTEIPTSSSIAVGTVTVGGSSGTQTLALTPGASCGEIKLTASEGTTVGAHGVVTLNSGTCGGFSSQLAGHLTNNGVVKAEVGLGGGRTLPGNISNTGKLEIATNTGLSSEAGASFVNEGQLEISSGVVLEASTSVTNGTGGAITAYGNGTMRLSGGTLKQGAGTITGSDPLRLESGSLALTGSGAATISAVGNVAFSGNVAAAQHLVLGRTEYCTSTHLSAAGGFTNSGTIVLAPNQCGAYENEITLAAGTLTNQGTIEIQAGDQVPRIHGAVLNEGSMTFAVDSSGYQGTLSGGLQNKGTLTVGRSIVVENESAAHSLRNEGTLSVGEGVSVSVYLGGVVNASGASLSLAKAAKLAMQNVAFTQGASAISGPGSVSLEAGSLALTGSGAATISAVGNVAFSGNVAAAQHLVLGRTEYCTSTHLSAAGGFTNSGTIVLAPNQCGAYENEITLAAGTLTNQGTIEIQAGDQVPRIHGAVLNEGSMTFAVDSSGYQGTLSGGLQNKGTLTVGRSIVVENESAAHSLRNEGTLSVGEGVSVSVYLGGVVNASGASLSLAKAAKLAMQNVAFTQGASAISGPGSVSLEAGSLALTGSGAATISAVGNVAFSGNVAAAQHLVLGRTEYCTSTHLSAAGGFTNSGTIVLAPNQCGAYENEITLAAGTLTNQGTIEIQAGDQQPRITGNLTNSRTLKIGAGKTLRLEGAYSQSESATLTTEIASGESFGALEATKAATIAGTLHVMPVGGFKAGKGQTFPFLTASSRTGSFAHVSGATISSTLYYHEANTATGAKLEVLEGEPAEKLPVNEALPVISGAAKQGETLTSSSGKWSREPIEYGYQWLRCNEAGSGCTPIAEATDPSYLLTGADAGHRLTVEVWAYNTAGQSDPAEPAAKTAVVQALPLHAAAGEALSAIEGQEVELDGSASTPASEITNYRWQFGDGEEAQGAGRAIVNHAYAKAGTYKAELTVSRGAEQSTDKVIVTVTAPPEGPAVHVSVRNTAEDALSGAEVLYIGSGGSRIQATSDGSGQATLTGLPAGSDTVYVYESGYQPKAARVTVNGSGAGSAIVHLESGEVATSELTSRELTLPEIEAAGIDTSDPANQDVYKFTIKLAFFEEGEVSLSGYVNGAGSFVGGSGGGGWTCGPDECVDGGGSSGAIPTIIAVPSDVGGHPLIQYLILKGQATVLKQFYEVSMVVQNLSEEGFNLAPGTAKLNLPKGVSLAPTGQAQSLAQSLGEIPGKGSASVKWIIRGDEEGEYPLSAGYNSTLEPLGAPVETLATTKNPLKVIGVKSLELIVEGDASTLVEGRPYHIQIALKNKAEVPLYNVQLAIDPTVHANYVFQPGQSFSAALGEVPPGTTSKQIEYIVAPDAPSVGKFNPALSSATFDGQQPQLGEGILENLAPPVAYKMTGQSSAPGYVHLSWEKVPDAEGYEVFSTPTLEQEGGFAEESEAVLETLESSKTAHTLPASQLSGYVKPPPGSDWFAVTAIVGGRPHLETTMIRALPGSEKQAPELGRCVKGAAGSGAYGSSKCTGAAGKKDYSWSPGAEHAGVTLAGGSLTLETPGRKKLVCKASSATGTIANGKLIQGISLRLTGCESAGAPCSSTGLSAGEALSSPLSATLQWQSKAAHKVLLQLYRQGGGTLLSLSCAGVPWTISGSALVAVKAGKMASSQSLKFKATKGLQKPGEYETGEGGKQAAALQATIGAEAPAALGLTSTLTLTGEEAVEVNTEV